MIQYVPITLQLASFPENYFMFYNYDNVYSERNI